MFAIKSLKLLNPIKFYCQTGYKNIKSKQKNSKLLFANKHAVQFYNEKKLQYAS